MRWFWIDRFTEFVSGTRAEAVKCVSLLEEYLDEYFPAYPVMTSSLIIEGFAQAGGLLLGECNGFRERIVLAKVAQAKFHFPPRPGDVLTYRVRLENVQPDGGLVMATSHRGRELQGKAELTFAHLDARHVTGELFEPAEFLRMLRIFRLYEVGVDQQGRPLTIPTRLVEAERQSLGMTD